FLGKNNAKEAHFTEFRHNFAGKARSFVPLHDMRSNFSFGELADTAAELVLFVGEGEIHGVLAVLPQPIARLKSSYTFYTKAEHGLPRGSWSSRHFGMAARQELPTLVVM